MPSSLPEFDEEIELLLGHAALGTVLDIGPGQGKYGRLLQKAQPAARRIAVEVDASYVEQYRLREIYHQVLVQDAARLMDDCALSCDAVILGDVIEHMPKSIGADLLHFLIYRTRLIIVKFPLQMPQDAWQGHASEAHRSVWSERDFLAFDRIFLQRDIMCLAILRGYQNRTIEWLPKEFIQKLGYENCQARYDQHPDLWELADLHTRRLNQMIADIRSVIPPDERFILIDENQSDLPNQFPGQAIPFVEKDGQYHGMPKDDAQAISQLNRLRAAGARSIVILRQSAWVMDHYPSFAGELACASRRIESQTLLAFVFQDYGFPGRTRGE